MQKMERLRMKIRHEISSFIDSFNNGSYPKNYPFRVHTLENPTKAVHTIVLSKAFPIQVPKEEFDIDAPTEYYYNEVFRVTENTPLECINKFTRIFRLYQYDLDKYKDMFEDIGINI